MPTPLQAPAEHTQRSDAHDAPPRAVPRVETESTRERLFASGEVG